MNIKIKRLTTEAVLPTKAHNRDAGADMYCTEVEHLDKYINYRTGIAIAIPEGHVGLLFPRSSVRDKDLILSNCVGVIDSGYTGEISFSYKKFKHKKFNYIYNSIYRKGDKIGQLLIVPITEYSWEEVDSLDETDRGNKGFGSTGN
jgi:dUTP pyrophosphatase